MREKGKGKWVSDVGSWLDFNSFAVFGLGRSGRAVSRLLADRGKRVIASDTAARGDFDGELEELEGDVELVFGGNELGEAEVAVVSPGLRPSLGIFEEVREAGVPIVSEIDIAFDATGADVLALTGTDGKTTTTSLLGRMAELSGRPSATGGNIGTPLSAIVDEVPEEGLIVAEVSAFQLWSAHHFRPAVAGFTNIAGDHLDYFESREEYREAKRRLQRNAAGEDVVVYNLDDPVIREWSRESPAVRATYGGGGDDEMEAALRVWARDGVLVAEQGGETFDLVERAALGLPGRHNVENAMCAAAMALAAGIDPDVIGEAIATFEALPHRVETCGEVDGVTFVNDSKATNVNASLAGLSSLEPPFVAIVGGVDKGLDLEPLCRYLAEHASGVVAIGEMSGRLTAELEPMVGEEFRLATAGTLEEATRRAYEWARGEGETVILSPACSSFDMFESYKHRGEVFRGAVERLSS